MPRSSPLERVRRICLALPGTSERASHGSPTFFIRDKRAFVMYVDNHHEDGRLALWCASSSDVQQMLATSRPEQFFVPAYVGHLGWIGARLDRDLSWPEIEGVIRDGYRVIVDKLPRRRARRAERPEDVTIVLDRTEGVTRYTEPELYDRLSAESDEAFRKMGAALRRIRAPRGKHGWTRST